MEIIIKAFLVKSIDNIEFKNHVVNDFNYIITRKKLEEQRRKIINILKKLKEEGLITSIYHPSNKRMKEQLSKLVTTKRLLKNSIEQIKISFYK